MTRPLAFLMLLALPCTAFAQCAGDAIPALSRGDRVTILKADGSTVRGTFERADSSAWIVDTPPAYARRPPRRIEIASPDVARLEVQGRKRMRGSTMFIAVVAGIALGAALEQFTPTAEDRYTEAVDALPDPHYGLPFAGNSDRNVTRTALGFGALGLLVGIKLSLYHDPARTWSCADSR